MVSFYFYFEILSSDLAVIIVRIIACDACLHSFGSVKINIKNKRKKLDSNWTMVTSWFDVLG